MRSAIYAAVGALVLGLALGVFGTASWYTPRLELARKSQKDAEGKRDLAVGANKQCSIDLGKADKAVKDLKQEAAERARLAASAVAAAEERAAVYERRAGALSRRPPTRPKDLCGSLDELLTEAIKERRIGR